MCDSCNADVLEYESVEKRIKQIRERILNSYKENITIQNLNTSIRTASLSNRTLVETNNDADSFLLNNSVDMENAEFVSLTEMDLVEEVPDDEAEKDSINVNILKNEKDDEDVGVVSFVDNVDSPMISENFDFAAFNEHVAQTSLPSGVLNLSNGLVNLEVTEKLPLKNQSTCFMFFSFLFYIINCKQYIFFVDIIIYDVNQDQLQQTDLVVKNIKSDGDIKNYDSTEGMQFTLSIYVTLYIVVLNNFLSLMIWDLKMVL